MQITDLNAIPQAPADDDVLAIEVSGVTYKISKSVLASAILAQIGGDPVTVAHGGTGLTASPSMLTNLASTSAANVMQATPRPGVTGTLPVTNGGTGLTASPSMLTNLASTTAANVMQASPRPGVTGTLPVSHGGTGLTASPSALTNLESTSAASVMQASPRPGITGTLPVSHGGTGATSTAAAKVALDINSSGIDFKATSPTSSTQIISLIGTVSNSANQYYGDRVGLVLANGGLLLWDFTTGQSIWTITP